MAQDIFSCHLSTSSPDAVNIDSFALQETKRRLQSASAELFDAPQRQVIVTEQFMFMENGCIILDSTNKLTLERI